MCAERLGIGREEQDAHAVASVERARAATAAGWVAWELAPVEVTDKRGAKQLIQEVRPVGPRCLGAARAGGGGARLVQAPGQPGGGGW